MLRARELAHEVRSGNVRARDLTEAALERAANDAHGAFLALAHAQARHDADAVDARVARGEDPGPLAGVPVAIKDNIVTEGVTTTAASRLLRDFIPPYDATVVARLRQAGAVVVGKTNLDEFGMGSSSEHSAFGPVLNPRDPTRVAGGSSGGSAAAVAAGVVPIALGTDTGGSVRQPAAFTGLVGVKPTYGRLSRYGVIAYASSLDQVGVLAGDADDAALALWVMAGADSMDASSHARARDEVLPEAFDPRGLKVGRITPLFDGLEAPVLAGMMALQARLEALGVEVVDIPFPLADAAVAAYYLTASSEASSNLARYDGTLYGARVGENAAGHASVAHATRSDGLGREVLRRILMGSFALSAGYVDAYAARAARVRRRIADELNNRLREVDVLLSPTAPTVAWRLGERADDPLSVYVADVATCLANLAGLPAVSFPVQDAGLPVGAQLMAAPWREGRLLAWVRHLHVPARP